MVREVLSPGQIRDFEDLYHSPENRSFRFMRVESSGDNNGKLVELLAELAKYPDFDRRSYLRRNRRMGAYVVDILAVPKDCPHLEVAKGDLPKVGELPLEDESFVSYAWRVRKPADKKPIFVLEKSFVDATIRARNLAKGLFHIPSWEEFDQEIVQETKLVTPQEFVEAVKQAIADGVPVPNFIKRFGDIRQFEEDFKGTIGKQ